MEAVESQSWEAELLLEFENKDSVTTLVKNEHKGPLMVQKPFSEDLQCENTVKPCHIYILHPPGGVAESDTLNITLKLDENCHVLATTPGATKFYKSCGKKSSLYQNFYLKEGSYLEYLPAQNIFYEDTNCSTHTNIYLEKSATFIYWDISCVGKQNYGFSGNFFTNVKIYKENKLKLIESNRIVENYYLQSNLCNGSMRFIGSLISSKVSDETLEKLKAEFYSFNKSKDCSISIGIVDDFLIIRMLSHDNELIEKTFLKLFTYLRIEIKGSAPVYPRIWST